MNPWYNDLADVISLDGTWEFSLGGQSGTVQVPGCWEAQGYPRRVDGPAVYCRTVTIPAAWAGRIVQLQFGAVSYHAEVEINGVPAGTHTGSWSPFALDVSHALRPGQENEIRLTIHKQGERFPLRESLAGFLPDVCLMFGGLWQSVRLAAFDRPALSEIAIRADAHTGEVRVAARIPHHSGMAIAVEVRAPDGAIVAIRRPMLSGDMVLAALTVPNPQPWSPGVPNLYTVEIRLDGVGGPLASVRRTFGFRTLSRQGDQLLFNDAPVCLRGVLNWGWYPDLLCPAPSDEAIRDEFRRVRALGYNMIKLCLYVPSARYFEIADQEGMFLWLELPMWLPQVTDRLREQAPVEYADILAAVHHHPSIVIYSLGCELGRDVDADFVAQLDAIARERAGGGALFCDNSGSGEAYGGAFDFADFNDYHFYADLQFFDPLVDHFSRDWRAPRPWIFGEFCDADDYRDLDEIAAHYGGELPWWATEKNPLHPTNFVAYQEQRDRMRATYTGMDDQALMKLSRRQSFAVRKTILEKVRARAGMGGYVVTSIRDTPLASSSMFDDLNRAKVDPESFRAFNADTVLLLGRGRARTWSRGGDRPAPFEPYNFLAGRPAAFEVILAHAGAPLAGGQLAWQVTDETGRRYAGDSVAIKGPLVGGRPQAIGRLAFTLPPLDRACTHHLEVTLDAGGRKVTNAWALWVFPEVSAWPENVALHDPSGTLAGLDDLWAAAGQVALGEGKVALTSTLDAAVLDHLRSGGSAVLIQQGAGPLPALALPFWREGIKIIQDHPAFAVPHAGFADVQFYGLAAEWAIQTERLGEVLPDVGELHPVLRRLDARRFFMTDYLIDLRVGRGRLIASTLRFQGGLGDQPAGLRFAVAGRWLLLNLLNALRGEA